MIGDVEAIDEAKTALKENGLVLNVVGGLQDSSEVLLSKDKNRALLGQPQLIENLGKKLNARYA